MIWGVRPEIMYMVDSLHSIMSLYAIPALLELICYFVQKAVVAGSLHVDYNVVRTMHYTDYFFSNVT